jgi:hypothetical protein
LGALFGKLIEKQPIPKIEQHVKAGKYLVVAPADAAGRVHETIQSSAASEVETH